MNDQQQEARASATSVHPLETRAFMLTLPGDTGVPPRIAEMRARGYNAALVPLLGDGEMCLRVTRGDVIDESSPAMVDARLVREEGLSTWLYLDIVAAGWRGAPSPSALARAHGDWLMRGPRGETSPIGDRIRPALFCWTSPGYRRFVADHLARAAEAIPCDAVMLDLRHVPVPDPDPHHWSCFGKDCLRSIIEELDIDVEDMLRDGDEDSYQRVEEWRRRKLEGFLAQLRARLSAARPELPVVALVRRRETPDGLPYSPWAPWLASGLLTGAALYDAPKDAREHRAEIDVAGDTPVPLLAVCDDEAQLDAQLRGWRELPVHGAVILRAPEPDHDEPLPPAPQGLLDASWAVEGVAEAYAIEAAEAMAIHLVSAFRDVDAVAPFFRELQTYFQVTRGRLSNQHVARTRENVRDLLAELRSGEIEIPAELRPAIVDVDRLTRLLSLVPVTGALG